MTKIRKGKLWPSMDNFKGIYYFHSKMRECTLWNNTTSDTSTVFIPLNVYGIGHQKSHGIRIDYYQCLHIESWCSKALYDMNQFFKNLVIRNVKNHLLHKRWTRAAKSMSLLQKDFPEEFKKLQSLIS